MAFRFKIVSWSIFKYHIYYMGYMLWFIILGLDMGTKLGMGICYNYNMYLHSTKIKLPIIVTSPHFRLTGMQYLYMQVLWHQSSCLILHIHTYLSKFKCKYYDLKCTINIKGGLFIHIHFLGCVFKITKQLKWWY